MISKNLIAILDCWKTINWQKTRNNSIRGMLAILKANSIRGNLMNNIENLQVKKESKKVQILKCSSVLRSLMRCSKIALCQDFHVLCHKNCLKNFHQALFGQKLWVWSRVASTRNKFFSLAVFLLISTQCEEIICSPEKTRKLFTISSWSMRTGKLPLALLIF